MSLLLASVKKNFAGGAQKHMEIVSLDVLRNLRQKNRDLTINAIIELHVKQIDYIVQIATEYDPLFARELA